MKQKQVKLLLGKRIKQLRKEQGLTQDSASEKCGSISEKRWSDIERGMYDVGVSTLYKIAHGLNISLHELFKFDESKTKKTKIDIFKKRISTLEKQTVKMDDQLKVLKKNIRELKSPLE